MWFPTHNEEGFSGSPFDVKPVKLDIFEKLKLIKVQVETRYKRRKRAIERRRRGYREEDGK